MRSRTPDRAQRRRLGWALLLAVAGVPAACNALWSVDGLTYGQQHGEGGAATGGGGSENVLLDQRPILRVKALVPG